MADLSEVAIGPPWSASADFNKYRTIVGSSIYVPVDFNK